MAIIINCGEWEISSHHFLCPIYGLCILVLTRCLASGRNECGACLDWQLTCDVLACPNNNNNKSNSLLFGIGKKSIGKYSISHTIRWDAATIAIGMQIENHKWNISIYVRVRIYFGHIRSRRVPWRRINNPISIFFARVQRTFSKFIESKSFPAKNSNAAKFKCATNRSGNKICGNHRTFCGMAFKVWWCLCGHMENRAHTIYIYFQMKEFSWFAAPLRLCWCQIIDNWIYCT